MKKTTLIAIVLCSLLFSCQNNSNTAQTQSDTTKLDYPFKPKYSIKWQPGDEKNALIILPSSQGPLRGCGLA